MSKVRTFCKENRGVLLALLSLVLTFAAFGADVVAFLYWKTTGLTPSSVFLPMKMVIVGLGTYALMLFSLFLAAKSDPGRCLVTGEAAKKSSILMLFMHTTLYLGYWALNFVDILSAHLV